MQKFRCAIAYLYCFYLALYTTGNIGSREALLYMHGGERVLPGPETDTSSETTPCERQLGQNQNGRYPRLIASEFLPGMVRANDGLNPDVPHNLFCVCTSINHMICTIWLVPGSVADYAVRMRLDRNRPDGIRPFFVQEIAQSSYGTLSPYIYYSDPETRPAVLARIDTALQHNPLEMGEVIKFRQPQSEIDLFRPKLGLKRRTQSSPAGLHYPVNSIPIRLCTQGSEDAVCPILQTPFQANDIVYVIKDERENIHQGKPVSCFSALGLQTLARKSEDGLFRDPFRRRDGSFVSLADYDVYVLFYDGPMPTSAPTEPKSKVMGIQAGPSFASLQDQGTQTEDSFPETHVQTTNVFNLPSLTILFIFSFILFTFYSFHVSSPVYVDKYVAIL